MITAIAMAVGAGALIIVLSTFNGFEDLVKSLYKVFYTDLIVLPAEGKFIEFDSTLENTLKHNPGIASYTQVIEENVLAEYHGKQSIFTMKGVDDNYFTVVNRLKDHMYSGDLKLYFNGVPSAVLGAGVAYMLGVNVMMPNSYLTLYMPRQDKQALSDIANAFRTQQIFTGGIFSVQQDFDNKYIIVPLDFAKNLMGNQNEISSIEIKLAQGENALEIKDKLSKELGAQYVVKTRYEQNETLYKVMKTEKWAVFAILSFIVLIAAFNIIASLSMLVIEKKKDIATLRALGADAPLIQKIFLIEGLLVSLLGALSGLVIGLIVCLIQIKFGVIKMPGASFMVSSYPVKIEWSDFVLVFGIIVAISTLMAWLPAHRSVKQLDQFIPGNV